MLQVTLTLPEYDDNVKIHYYLSNHAYEISILCFHHYSFIITYNL